MSEEAPKCGCGQVAVVNVSQRPGPNKGRHFYGCANFKSEQGCGYFSFFTAEQEERLRLLTQVPPSPPAKLIELPPQEEESGSGVSSADVFQNELQAFVPQKRHCKEREEPPTVIANLFDVRQSINMLEEQLLESQRTIWLIKSKFATFQ